ncbi:chemotaxis protein CheW [Pararobbsia silviterrae]|uniref:Chemotaxis protein CheW n=1 Tax=Pararobbsia silviterrae TaxID=1792498 RepID=A0A494X8R0_9BURK|nr:chemotaxis protein CheW [Pararobbsia silviterrae]RKP46632.1 chemotaxis protein CheW [Pararobbsia silviterrae]
MDMLELADQLDSRPGALEAAYAPARADLDAAAALAMPARLRAGPDPLLEANLYGSFYLGHTEFALPVSAIHEVVVFPSRVTPIPLSPAFLIGVFNLRGAIIPIVDLRAILGMSDTTERDTQKVAIVDFAGTRIGLVFDATGEMLRVRPTDRHPFHFADDDPAHAAHRAARHVVKGALKLEGGERIVQILDAAELMQIEQVPQILDKQRAGGLARRAVVTQRHQCVSFRLGDAALAFEIGAIHEIVRVPEIAESVLKSELCIGMFNLRGDLMPLVDFGALLGLPSRAASGGEGGKAGAGADDARRILVMRIGDDQIGLLVDSVDSIVGYTAEQLLPIPGLGARRAGLFAGCVSREGHDDIVLLAHTAVLTSDEIHALTQGHSHLYAHGEGHRANARQRGERHVYITFRLDSLMAVPITGVREIIRYTDDFMRPPGLPAAVCGMLNLRRRLVTIVDLRALYALAPRATDAAAHANAKILIIERGDDAYGLIVDSVENISNVFASDKMAVPSIMMDATQKRLRADLTEIVEVQKSAAQAHEGKPTQVMMIFDVVKLMDRVAQMIDA